MRWFHLGKIRSAVSVSGRCFCLRWGTAWKIPRNRENINIRYPKSNQRAKTFPMFLWLCAENDRCRRIPPWFGKILRDTDISVWVRGKSIQDCQRRSGQSFKLYENHRWNIEGKGASHRYRESWPDPYLFRCEVWTCKGGSCRNYLCSDRPFPDTSGTGIWDWTGIWDASSGTCIKLQNSASRGLWYSPDA